MLPRVRPKQIMTWLSRVLHVLKARLSDRLRHSYPRMIVLGEPAAPAYGLVRHPAANECVESCTDCAEFKQPSRLNATPPPEPSEVDVRHAELAEKFASFAAYIKQHEERAPPPPVLGTRVRTMSLRSTKSLGHLDGHVLGNRSLHAATQGPTR